jgi:EmrB/QacA subfamily drug resistance transporter
MANAMIGNFLFGTATSILNISLPTIAASLGTDMVGVSWALIAYQLSSISLFLVFGRMGDLYGRSRIYALGLLAHMVSSFLCGLSRDIYQLISFRVLQGVGAAMAQSQARALAMDALPEGSGGKAQGLMSTAFYAGFALGPGLGGLIIDTIHWRAIFFFLVPIAAAGALLTFMNLKRLAHPHGRPVADGSRIDYLGALLIVVSTVALMTLVDRNLAGILTSAHRVVLGLLFAVCFLGFLRREATFPSPLVDLSLFKIRMFACSAVSLLLVSLTQAMSSFIMPFYLQEILGLQPTFIGFIFMSAVVCTVTFSPLSGHISDRVGPRVPATLGVFFLSAAVLPGLMLRTDSHWLLPNLMVMLTGLAGAFFHSPNTAAMIGSVPRENRGFATAALQIMFSLGHALGISLGTFVMTLAFQFHTGLATARLSAAEPTAFTAAMNLTYGVALALSFVTLIPSSVRGRP